MAEDNGIMPYPSLAQARFTQVVLVIAGLFSAMDLIVVGLLIEPMKHELGLTDVEVGLAHTTAFFAGYGLFAIPMGMLADRLVRVRLLLIAMLLWCAGLALVGLSHDLWLLAAAKAVMGLAGAITYPTAISLLADNFAPERRAFATATYAIGQDLGTGAALLVGGVGYSALVAMAAADPHALGGISPWRAVSLIFAGIGLQLIPAILIMREPARMELQASRSGSFRDLWDYRRFLIPLFIGMMALGGQASCIRTWFAPALTRLYGLQPGDFAAWSSVVVLVGGLVGILLGSRLINMVRERGNGQAGMVIAAVASALCIPACFLAVAPAVWGFAALGCFYVIANAVAMMVPVVVISLRIPNDLRGLCMGIYIVLLSATSMIGAPLTGYVSQLIGGDALLGEAMALVGAPFSLLAALSFWATTWRRSAAQSISSQHGENRFLQGR